MNNVQPLITRFLGAFSLIFPFLIIPIGKEFYYANVKVFYFLGIMGLLLIVSIGWKNELHLHLKGLKSRVIELSLLMAYCLLLLASTIHSSFPSWIGVGTQHQGLIVLLALAILYSVTSVGVPRSHMQLLLRWIQYSACVCSIYGILQHYHIGLLKQDQLVNFFNERSYSLFDNPDYFGSYLVITYSISLILLLVQSDIKHRSVSFVCLCVQFVVLLDTGTRSAWVGAAVSSLLLTVYIVIGRRQHLLRLVIIVISLFILFIGINRLDHHHISNRAVSITDDAHAIVTNKKSNAAGSSRWYIWKSSMPIIMNHVWLGTGPNSFQQVYNPKTIPSYHKYLGNKPIYDENNQYLQIALTTGIPSLICYVLFLLILLYRGVRQIQRLPAEQRILQVGLMSACVGYLIQACFNINVISEAPYFWMILGLISV